MVDIQEQTFFGDNQWDVAMFICVEMHTCMCALPKARALFELLDEAILLLNKLALPFATLAIISTTRARRFTIIPGRGVAVSIIARLVRAR